MEWIDNVRSTAYQADCREDDGERSRADVEADLELVGEKIGNLGADDADQDHCQPVDPRHVTVHTELDDERDDEQTCHEETRYGRPETDVDGEIVGAGLAERRRHDLDDPEDEGDLGDLVEHVAGTSVSKHVEIVLSERYRREPPKLGSTMRVQT